MRDRTLDAVQLPQGDLRVLDVFTGTRVFAHLLHQALGRRDRVADLVGNRGRELLHRTRVSSLESAALLRECGLDLIPYLLRDELLADPGLQDEPVELPHAATAPDQDDQGRNPERLGEDQDDERDYPEPDGLDCELRLALGDPSYLAVLALLGG